jgi:hypothetical protein
MRLIFQTRSELKFDGRTNPAHAGTNPDEARIGARPKVGTTNTEQQF